MGKYDDLLPCTYPFPMVKPRMSMHDRAAQFAPFAALTGHDEAIAETARRTSAKPEIDETEKERIDFLLRQSEACISPISVTYFIPDSKKEGGIIVTAHGVVQKIDRLKQKIVMDTPLTIPIEDICGAEDR